MNKKKILTSILIIVLSLVITVVIKNEYSRLLLKDASYGIPALIEKREIRNLYIGSSMFRQGLDIYILEDGCEDSYILAYNGNQPATEQIELEYILDKGVTIKNLYVDMYLYTLTANPSISDEKIFLELDTSTKYKLWDEICEHKLDTFWSMWVTSNNDQLLTWPVSSRIVNSQFHKGGTISETGSLSTNEYIKLSAPTSDNVVDDKQRDAIVDIIKLCEENDINLCFVDTPKSLSVCTDESYRQGMDDYRKLLDEHNVLYICQGEDYDFDISNSRYYQDAIHLSSVGRREFSAILNDAIR